MNNQICSLCCMWLWFSHSEVLTTQPLFHTKLLIIPSSALPRPFSTLYLSPFISTTFFLSLYFSSFPLYLPPSPYSLSLPPLSLSSGVMNAPR